MADRTESLQNPTLAQVLFTAMDARIEDLHTTLWGYVLAYNKAKQSANIQLIPRRAYFDAEGDRQTERPSPLLDVPVIFPGSGARSITWTLKPGEVVMVHFFEQAFDGWNAGGAQDVDTGDDRRHSLSDAVCVPGLRARVKSIVNPSPDDGMTVAVDDNENLYLGSPDADTGVGSVRDLNALYAGIKAVASSLGMAGALFDSTFAGGVTSDDPSYGSFPRGAKKLKVKT